MWIYNKWFKVKLLTLNFDKTQYFQFITGNSSFIDMKIGYNNNLITNVSNTKISWNSYRKYVVLENQQGANHNPKMQPAKQLDLSSNICHRKH
jgi:hypothetical protein